METKQHNGITLNTLYHQQKHPKCIISLLALLELYSYYSTRESELLAIRVPHQTKRNSQKNLKWKQRRKILATIKEEKKSSAKILNKTVKFYVSIGQIFQRIKKEWEWKANDGNAQKKKQKIIKLGHLDKIGCDWPRTAREAKMQDEADSSTSSSSSSNLSHSALSLFSLRDVQIGFQRERVRWGE